MALTFPTVNGNWSNPAIWSGSTLPTVNDDVFANAKTVIIDQNISIKTLRNAASGSALVGGSFTVSGSYNITTTNGLFPTNTYLLNVTNNLPNVVNINSALDMSAMGAGSIGVYLSGSGTVNIVGNIEGFGNNTQTGYYMFKSGILNLVGNLNASPSGNGFAYLINIIGVGAQVNITGDVTQVFSTGYNPIAFGASSSLSITGNINTVASCATAIIPANQIGNKVTIVGNINSAFPSPTVSPIVLSSTSQSLDLTGNVFASLSVPAVSVMSTTSNVILRGTNLVNSFQTPGFSRSAVFAPCLTIVPSNQFRWTFYNAPSSSLKSTMFVQGYVPDSPSQSDVRFGTTYLAGTLSGSVQMPQPNQVISGVKTDNTTGSYDVTVAALTEAVWSKLTSTLTGSNTIGERLKNNSTIDSTGQQLQALI